MRVQRRNGSDRRHSECSASLRTTDKAPMRAGIFAGIGRCPKPENVSGSYSFYPLALRNPMMLYERAVPGMAVARVDNGGRTSYMNEARRWNVGVGCPKSFP